MSQIPPNIILASKHVTPKWSNHFRLPTKIMYAFHVSPTCSMYPTHHISRSDITLNVFGEQHK